MTPCERDDIQPRCLDAGEHVCDTKYAFTLPYGEPAIECPGCVRQSSKATGYCERHCSHVSLDDLLGAFAAAKEAEPPAPLPPGVDGEIIAEARRRYPQWEWHTQADDYDTFIEGARWLHESQGDVTA